MFCITKWCKAITDSGKDEYTGRGKKMKDKLAVKYGIVPVLYKFRLLDDDDNICAYGLSTSCDDEAAFNPLDAYCDDYGLVSIEYKNLETGEWEEL